jgi:hypothetical protein
MCDEGLTWNCFTVWQISFRSVKDIVLLGTLSKDDPVLGLGFPLQEGIEESLVIFQTSVIEESKLLIMNTVITARVTLLWKWMLREAFKTSIEWPTQSNSQTTLQ